jgi:hypothetical protein
MSSNDDFSPGLAGVIAFETEIAEPDKDGGELRYRGVNIEDLVGKVPFEQVWGLLVDGSLHPGLPYEHIDLERRTGGHISDLQSTLAALSGEWKLGQFIDIDDEQAKEDLRRLSAAALSIVAQSARGADLPPVPKETVAEGQTAAERFVLEWRGELNEKSAKAIDTYWISTAEHGLNASTFTARIVASTGADAGAALSSAVGALSGPLHGGAPARVLPMLDAVAASAVRRSVRRLAEHRHPTLKELDEAVPDRPVLLYERFTGPCATNTLGKKFFDAVDAAPPVHADIKRVNVSGAYFLSIEFQETGYLVYRFYNAALNRSNGLPRYVEFLKDTQSVGRGVVVDECIGVLALDILD